MSVPNPKTAAELLALPEWEGYERVTIMTPEDAKKYRLLFANDRLRLGDTVELPKPEEFTPNPVDPDTVFAARDAHGDLWAQQGHYRRRLSL